MKPNIDVDSVIREKQRLLSERNKLYRKLNTIGFIPDEDMREVINSIRDDLERRIEALCTELVEIGG